MMKRKLDLTETYSDKKMLKWNTTELNKMNVSDDASVGGARKFNFKLTEQKARKNLLKSPKRTHLQIEAKQNCKNLRFSPGAYVYIAKKMIEECHLKFRDNATFVYEDLKIQVVDFQTGHELNKRHIDTKVVFSVNGQKVVMHCYNSTQNLKLDGIAHSLFLDKFLGPLFFALIDDLKEEIE